MEISLAEGTHLLSYLHSNSCQCVSLTSGTAESSDQATWEQKSWSGTSRNLCSKTPGTPPRTSPSYPWYCHFYLCASTPTTKFLTSLYPESLLPLTATSFSRFLSHPFGMLMTHHDSSDLAASQLGHHGQLLWICNSNSQGCWDSLIKWVSWMSCPCLASGWENWSHRASVSSPRVFRDFNDNHQPAVAHMP